jgi:hypothetical protein
VLVSRGDAAGALAAAREAIALAGTGPVERGDAVVRLAWAEALHLAGDGPAARQAIADARDRLLVRIAAIEDPELRLSFAEGVPENARTLELAAAWLAC